MVRTKLSLYILLSTLLLLTIWGFRSFGPSAQSLIPNHPASQSPSTSTSTSTSASTSISISQNVAAIIETRPMTTLIPLILHFSSVLGPEWPIHFFTDLTPQSFKPPSAALARAVAQGSVILHPLPKDQVFSNHDTVSEFLTTPWLWEQLAPAGHVLIFQADSIICANSPTSINDFLDFDFIGAPISKDLGHGDQGMNGGLSIRNRTLVLDILAKHSWKKELEEAEIKTPKEQFEDQWLYQKMLTWPGARLPGLETGDWANKFSVESMWYDEPLGYHQIARWNMGHEKEIAKYCPEYMLGTAEYIGD